LLLGIALLILATTAGYGVLRVLGLAQSAMAIGLSPAAGLALFPVLATWSILLHTPLESGPLLLVGASLGGLAALIADPSELRLALGQLRAQRAAAILLAAGLVLPAFVLGSTAYVQLGVPNYANDAAFHVETIQAVRTGEVWQGWYPPGSHATLAAYLQLFPTVDSAGGAAGASLALALAAPLVLFALAWAGFRDLPVAAAAALLSALTFHYPYSPHFWSFWPLAWGTLLTLALLAVGLEYVRQPCARLAILGGLLAAAIVLVHGSELYTLLVGLLIIALASWRRLPGRLLVIHVAVALLLVLALSGPYLAALLGWAGAGGAGNAAVAEFGTRGQAAHRSLEDEALFWLNTFTAGIVVDSPVRLALLGAGVWLALRERGARPLAAVLVGLYGLVVVLRYVDTPLLQRLFQLTFPWGLTYRLTTAPSALAGILEGAGCVYLWRLLARLRFAWRPSAAPRLRLAASAAAAAFLVGSAGLLAKRVSAEAAAYLSYTADDALAMRWLAQHAQRPGVVVNDGSEDGAIWAPYKAGLSVLEPRTGSGDPLRASLIEAHAADLNGAAAVSAAACAAGVRYIYRGSLADPAARRLPTSDELRRSSALEEVFTSGQVAVFRVRLNC
jgi:hypothetical protein